MNCPTDADLPEIWLSSVCNCQGNIGYCHLRKYSKQGEELCTVVEFLKDPKRYLKNSGDERIADK